MRVLVNSYIKRDHYGNFMSGQVLFESLVTNEENSSIPDSLKVNLSKHHNPECDTPIKFLQTHSGHAGSFGSQTIMQEYVRRVVADITDMVSRYNADIEEYQSTDEQVRQPILEHNEDLAPPPVFEVPGVLMFEEFQEFIKSLMEDEGLDLEEDED